MRGNEFFCEWANLGINFIGKMVHQASSQKLALVWLPDAWVLLLEPQLKLH